MRCETCHELLSADLDGALDEVDRPGLDRHLADCAPCRAHAARVVSLHRALRVAPAEPVPDLTDRILAAHDRSAPARLGAGRLRQDLRWVLAALGLVQIAVAMPAVLRPAAQHLGHTGPHSAGWDVAYGLALVVAAIQPWRALGLLPVAGAVTAIMVGSAVLDRVTGRAEAMPGVSHLVEVVSLGLLWAFARWFRPPRTRRRDSVEVPAGPRWRRPPLRVVPRPGLDGNLPTLSRRAVDGSGRRVAETRVA